MARKGNKVKQEEVRKGSKKKATEKPGFLDRIKNFFSGLAKEIKRVVWPSRKTVKETAVVVVVVVALVLVMVFIVDSIMVGLLNLMGFNTAPMTVNPEQPVITEPIVEETTATVEVVDPTE